jgi:hypothetical protein
MAKSILSASLIFIGSVRGACALGACQGGPGSASEPGYRAGPKLLSTNDPLVPKREFPAWNPPRQFAVWAHPRADAAQGLLLGGQWILENLTDGGWYVEEFAERDPLPDAEATPEDLEAARRAVGKLSEFVIPYRVKE